jgi:hypothetical protein
MVKLAHTVDFRREIGARPRAHVAFDTADPGMG